MNTYTTLSGHTIAYEAAPAVAAFIDRVGAASDDPAVSEDDLVALVYGRDNPILDHAAIPGRGAITATVLADPVYRVLTDLLFRKHVAENRIDMEKLAARYTLSVAEAAERLGVSRSAVLQAIGAGRLSAWMVGGRNRIDPRSLASFKVQLRGPKPTRRSKPRASTEPLDVRGGHWDGKVLRIKALGHVEQPTPAGQIGVDYAVSPWRRVGLLVGAGGKLRFSILEPAEEQQEVAWGAFRVRGRFRVAEKINNARAAREAWEAFTPA